MDKLKDVIFTIAKREKRTTGSLAKLAGFTFKQNFSQSVGNERISFARLKELAKALDYEIVFRKEGKKDIIVENDKK